MIYNYSIKNIQNRVMSIGWVVALCAGILPAIAQQPDSQIDSPLALMAGTRDGKILVKAIPRNKEVWFYSTRSGIRYSFARLENGEWGAFTPFPGQPQLPGTPEAFEMVGSDFAKAMNFAVHEQDYIPKSQSFADIHATNDDFSKQFLFYVLMSCYAPELSELSGFQIEIPAELAGDIRIRAEVQGNTKYMTEWSFNTHELPPTIPGPKLEAEPGDRQVSFRWNHKVNERHIAAYRLFRSRDERNYEALGSPIIYNASSEEGKLGMIGFKDSLPENYTDYWYKLRGYDLFGYLTEETPSIKIKGKDRTPPRKPTHLGINQTSPEHVMITWQHVPADDFAGFQVIGSTEELGEYRPLHDKLLPADQPYFQYSLTDAFYKYYRIMAIDTAYNAAVSDIAYLVEVDTVPPPISTIVSAVCDTSGIVTLNWEPSNAPDIKGYRVFKAFHPSHGFHPITPVPIQETSFVDTLGRRLEKKVYYRIVALDTHFNHSQPSEYEVVSIPDIIPPTAPLMHDSKLNEIGHPVLSWKGSSSNDVASYKLYRIIDNDSAASVSFELGPEERSFSDTGFPDLGVKYAVYAVSATDSSGNESERSNIRRVFGTTQGGRNTEVQSADYDGSKVTITWPENNVVAGGAVLIYRAENDGPFTILGRSESGTLYVDQRIQEQSRYTYKLGVVEETGKRWALSPSMEVITSR
jgi:hypothetical protein